jgi:hypothetical protein
MLLLVFVTIYIYNKYSQLAREKNLNPKKWGIIGSALYLGLGIGLQFLVGTMIGLGYVNMDLDNFGVNFTLGIVSYAIGGLAAYMGYKKLSAMPDENPDIENFGKKTEEKF